MARDRSLVRASDIGSWTFCQRAWWLANVQKVAPQNSAALEHGNRVQHAHGRQVTRVRQLNQWGLLLIGAALVLMALFLFLWTMM